MATVKRGVDSTNGDGFARLYIGVGKCLYDSVVIHYLCMRNCVYRHGGAAFRVRRLRVLQTWWRRP